MMLGAAQQARSMGLKVGDTIRGRLLQMSLASGPGESAVRHAGDFFMFTIREFLYTSA